MVFREEEGGGQKDRGQNKGTSLLRWIQRNLICVKGQTYDLVKAKNQLDNSTSGIKDKFLKCRKSHELNRDEKFYLSLYNEGLLKHNIILNENGKMRSIVLVYQFPVLNICYGFDDCELTDYGKENSSTADFRYTPTNDPNPWIKTGLAKVLGNQRSYHEEPRVDGIPASTWLDIMEPVLQTMLIMKKVGRANRTNVTKHKKHSPLHRNRRVIVGDVQQTYFMVGPHMNNQADLRVGIYQMFAHRMAELGERAWRRENRFTPPNDRDIPFLRELRESTRNRPPRQEPVPSWQLPRSQSTSDLNVTYDYSEYDDGEVSEDDRIERDGYMVFH